AHDVIEALTDEYDVAVGGDQLQQLINAFLIEIGLQDVVKVFLAEQVQPILAHSAEERMQDSCSEAAVGCVQERPEQCGQRQCAAPSPSFGEGLTVPGEETDRPHRPEVQEGTFHAPVGNGGSDQG